MDLVLAIVSGFILGCLHAFDADHLTAVTAFASRKPGGTDAAQFGFFWGLGHTATLVVLGGATVVFRFVIPATFASFAEFAVGLVLAAIGVWTLKEVFASRHLHVHRHEHDGVEHVHIHSHKDGADHRHQHSMFLVGATHGIAGTAAVMVVLPVAISQSPLTAGMYLLLFGIGTILAMSAFAYVLGQVARGLTHARILPWFRGAAGFASVTVGVVWITSSLPF